MIKIPSSLNRFRLSIRWFRKAPSGSVLILVVALIVILALLGTAFVATARIDRYTAGLSASTSIASAQLQSLQSEVCNDIANGLFDQTTGNYRPVANEPPIQGTGVTSPTYGHFDSSRWYPGSTVVPVAPADPVEWDTWLADRIPTTYTDTTNNINSIAWRSVTCLPGRISPTSNLVTPLPMAASVTYNPWGYYAPPPAAPPAILPPTMSLIPTAIAVTYPRSTSENPPNTPKVYPAFAPLSIAAVTNVITYGSPFLAADADGDGIADSLLFPLNVTSSSPSGTITYFAAVRIVDNNSAVNLNTAWSRFSDFTTGKVPGATGSQTDALASTAFIGATGAANLGWLPSHVGLLEMLDPQGSALFPTPASAQAEMFQLNGVRFGIGTGTMPPSITSMPYDSAPPAGGRADYSYLTLGDALWNQLGRRIQNPAVNGLLTVPSGGSLNYQAVNDSGELAFRFNLIDPSANPNPQTSATFGTAVTDISQSAPTKPEQIFDYSLYTDVINWTQYPAYNRWSVYPPDKAAYWYDYNFNNGSYANNPAPNSALNGALARDNETTPSNITSTTFYRNLRALAVSRNPVSNAAPIHSFYGVGILGNPPPLNNPTGRQVPVPPPGPLVVGGPTPVPTASFMDVYPTAPKIPIRASINTDDFGTLWRAFWNVMCDDLNPGPNAAGATGLPSDHTLSPAGLPYSAVYQLYTPPVDIANAGGGIGAVPPVPQIAAASMKWPQYDQLLIRAAVAAVNAEGLRDPDRNTVISRCIVLPDGVTVEVFSNKLQPYIIAYDQTGKTDMSNKPTLTLANPTNSTISMNGWVLVYYLAGSALPSTPTLLTTDMPTSINAMQVVNVHITNGIPNTTLTTDQILLMRPRLSTGVPIPSPNTVDPFSEVSAGNSYWDYIPLDYVVYSQSFPYRGNTLGTTANWTGVQALLAAPGSQPLAPLNTNPIQVFNDDFAGPYAPNTTSNSSTLTSAYPFGAFARLGDILKVPFIGSYRVIVPPLVTGGTPEYGQSTPQATTPLQFVNGTLPAGTASGVYFVPISMDAAACYTGTQGEEVGHFCPITDDPSTFAAAPAPPNLYSYDWAKRIFDYFTVIQNPGNDFSPNVNPGFNDTTLGISANWSSRLYNQATLSWPSSTVITQVKNPPQNDTITGVTAIANTTATINSPNGTNNSPNDEDNVGIDGLININTASWQVLASLPMVPAGTADPNNIYPEANIALAHAIVLWRDGDGTTAHPAHGPFKSIFDLNLVTDGIPKYTFQNGWGTLTPIFTGTTISTGLPPPTAAQGNFSPAPPIGTATPPTADAPDNDFVTKFLELTKISNLITTRSDTFTCYIVVQGWLNAGTTSPSLVSQQRLAFIANRVATGPGNVTVQTTPLSAPP